MEVLLERRGPVALVTLNRPERLNAFTPDMHRRYRSILAEIEADPTLRVAVVTGAGRGFCAGADTEAVEAVAGGSDGGPRPTSRSTRSDAPRPGHGSHPSFDRPFAYHLGLRTPVVAAVNGAAAGLGFVLACYCDVRIASPRARFTTAFGPLGLPAEYGLSWILPRLIGGSRANEIILSSRKVDAGEALASGLVHRVGEDVVDAAVAYASELARRVSPGALATTKRQLYADWMLDLGDAYDAAVELTKTATRGDEFREGVAALRERRPPDWTSPNTPS